MTSITIFGTGNMGTAIGKVFSAGGATVQHIGHGQEATVQGDIVVLAVPYQALQDIAGAYADQLKNKVVVDITNPVDFETFDSLVVSADGSAAAELADALPSSHVLKAFNTTFAGTLAAGTVGGLQTTVLVAGDDNDAKAELIGLISAGGLRAIDAGGLKRARELEALGLLQITLAATEKVSWTGGFAVAP
jgi:NADPH-dependent F420 reductase